MEKITCCGCDTMFEPLSIFEDICQECEEKDRLAQEYYDISVSWKEDEYMEYIREEIRVTIDKKYKVEVFGTRV